MWSVCLLNIESDFRLDTVPALVEQVDFVRNTDVDLRVFYFKSM